MDVLIWVLLAPVAAITAVVVAVLMIAGIYGLAVAGVATAVVSTYLAAGLPGVVAVGVGVVAPVVTAVVVRRRRFRGSATRTTDGAPVDVGQVRPEEVSATAAPAAAVAPPAHAPLTVQLPALPQAPKGRCPVCGRSVLLTPARGRIKTHVTKGQRCAGMGMTPDTV